MIQQTLTEDTSVNKDVGMPLAVDSSASDSSTVSRNSNSSPNILCSTITDPTKSPLPTPISVPSPMGVAPVKTSQDTNTTINTAPSSIPKISPQPTTTDTTTMSMPSTTHTRTAVPDPISSAAGWSGIGTATTTEVKNEQDYGNATANANANVNGNASNMPMKNTVSVPQVSVSVGVNSNPNPSSSIQVVKTEVQPQVQVQPQSQAEQQQQRAVAQIASRGGIRHSVGVAKRESVPVPVPITVTSNPISSMSSHVTPASTSTVTSMPLQPIPTAAPVSVPVPVTVSAGGGSITNTNNYVVNNPDLHMDHTKKSPRLEGMEDKSSRSPSLSLPDPTSVPNTCASSVSTSSSNTGTVTVTSASTVNNPAAPAAATTSIPAPTTSAGITLSNSIGVSSGSSALAPTSTTTTAATATATPLSLSPQYPPMTQMSSTVGLQLGGSVGVGGGISGLHSSSASAALLANPPDRKQKRLQRNRESARLSRRRRKQYLEVLEERVNFLCEEMDRGRREHVLSALSNIRAMRTEVMNALVEGVMASTGNNLGNSLNLNQDGPDTVMSGEGGMISQDLYQKMNMLLDFRDGSNQTSGLLSRMSSELMLAVTFGREYLKSLVIPPSKKYIMWLTLQNDVFFRGGRAASERLSAARIGEKVSILISSNIFQGHLILIFS